MAVRNVGRVIISAEKQAELLDFKGMVIWGVGLDRFNRVELLVEHPDLPGVMDGDVIPEVVPSYAVSTEVSNEQ